MMVERMNKKYSTTSIKLDMMNMNIQLLNIIIMIMVMMIDTIVIDMIMCVEYTVHCAYHVHSLFPGAEVLNNSHFRLINCLIKLTLLSIVKHPLPVSLNLTRFYHFN
jgi:hypothetical protein